MKLMLSIFLLSFLMISCGKKDDAEPAKKSQEVNIYTHRHYDIDKEIFARFTKETGIKVNVVTAEADELMMRLEKEGANSPADILVTVDAARLFVAKEKGLLMPFQSPIIDFNVAPAFRDQQRFWIGLTRRARVIVFSKERVDPMKVLNYEDLVSPAWKKKILMRSSENVYNQSLVAAFIARSNGDTVAAGKWIRGLMKNLAKEPAGGDRDQIKAIAAGEGDVSIINTYYYGLMANSKDKEERAAAEKVGIIFPDQTGNGTHVNISGAGVLKSSPNKQNAIKLLEYLTGEAAQTNYALGNYEYPVNPIVQAPEVIRLLGTFKEELVDMNLLGKYNKLAVEVMKSNGWK